MKKVFLRYSWFMVGVWRQNPGPRKLDGFTVKWWDFVEEMCVCQQIGVDNARKREEKEKEKSCSKH